MELVDKAARFFRQTFGDGEPTAKGEAWERFVPIVKADEEKRLVYGVVYEPDEPDAHGDFMTAAEIEKSAHGFMASYARSMADAGTDHRSRVRRDKMAVVESYVAPDDFDLGDETITKGTWVMVGHVPDDGLWKGIKEGQWTGWSLEGFGKRVAA